MVRLLLAVTGVFLVQAFAVTPIQKVIELLEGLESKVTAQGAAEAETYNSFACFCSDSTLSKSTSITEGKDTIELLSASIEEDSAKAGALEIENRKTAKSIEVSSNTIAGLEKELATLRAVYAASNADLTAAILAVQKAITSLEAGKPATLLQVAPVVKAVALLH
jgi:DNA-binding XRE family transcriptional regulator